MAQRKRQAETVERDLEIRDREEQRQRDTEKEKERHIDDVAQRKR